MMGDGGRLLVNTSEVYYTGTHWVVTEGHPCLDCPRCQQRSALGRGAAFSHQIERCTQYDQFDDLMESVIGYPSQLDRAVVISLIQSLWDATDTNTWTTLSEGWDDRVQPFEMIYIGSIGDLQISNISTSRALRNADASILSSSSIHPYGLPITEGGEGQLETWASTSTEDSATLPSKISWAKSHIQPTIGSQGLMLHIRWLSSISSMAML